MKIKRIVSALLAALLVLGCFAGCGKEKDTEESLMPSISTDATGRYVEKNIPLPDSWYAEDMVMLSDGRLRVALKEENGNILLCTSSLDGSFWEETTSVPAEVLSSGDVESVALSPDGTVFCDTLETLENDTHQPHFWVIDPSGNCQEIPVSYPDVDPEAGYFIPQADFTADGRLMLQFYLDEMRELDLTTGELGPNLNELSSNLFRFGCAGNSAYMLTMTSGSVHQDGETKALPDVLKAQIEASLEETYGNTPRIVFWENNDGYLFFTTHDGLYSYIPGGSVTEELVSGARSSLGDPTFVPVTMVGAEDGSFYILGNQDNEPVLCHFTFDEAAPTTPDTQLRIYSLYEDEDLRQMISQFQKTNPEISVDLEIGLSGDDGMTEADAVRTLNTEILAGNGPDLIRLDGFDINTYLEKGLLADVSHVLAQFPLLEQVTSCYAQDGKVCAVPTTFALPAMYGPGHIVSQIHDLPSLVAAAQQAQAENTLTQTVLNGILPVFLADVYYDSCSAAWINPDGTLDEGKLAEYYAAMQALYAIDEPYRRENADMLAAWTGEMASYYIPGEYTGISGAMGVCMGTQYLTSGTLDGMMQWSYGLAGDDQLDGFETIHFSGQASGVFLPRRIMGILTTGAHPQAAETFLAFMLSEEVQAKSLTTGFPVNEAVFDTEIAEDRVSDSSFASGDADGNMIVLYAQYPDALRRQELKTWVDNLTTPALTNRTIRTMVMEQMSDCCNGIITPEQAARNAVQSLNLYLSE